jgi:hypothetical protein
MTKILVFIDSSFTRALPQCRRLRDALFDDSYYGSFLYFFVSFFELQHAGRLTWIKRRPKARKAPGGLG